MKDTTVCREHVVPDKIKLKFYSEQEVKQLSVVKIFLPITFNSLGHAIPGGLYDLAMGPISEKGDPCTTCGQNYSRCKGHLGHIELPAPVINTFFFRDVQLLLKLSCFYCHKINIPAFSQLLFINQLKLLNAGYVIHAQDLEATLFNEENLRLSPTVLHKLVTDHVEEILAHGNQICDMNDYKGGEELRSAFVAQVISRHVKRICIFCNKSINSITYQQRKIVKSFKIEKENLDQSSKNISLNMKTARKREQDYVMVSEVQADFQKVWTNEQLFLKSLIPALATTKEMIATDVMFLRCVVVPPNNLRPLTKEGMPPMEHSNNKLYQDVLYASAALKSVITSMNNKDKSDMVAEALKGIRGDTLAEKLHNSWHDLQYNVDVLMDANLSIKKVKGGYQIPGLKQMLDGKTGMIRQNMMGKRVNYAGRSVITPDPYLNIDSIGVPVEFAQTLTYPVPVTPWNVTLLRKMVMNGPNVYPGANMIQHEDGSLVRISPFQAVQRESLAKRLITPEGNVAGRKIIYRHMLNGDLLLVNRQPTLHKPSIMAHKAKILSEEKTLRLHYANCKAYNADFDGDEMNIHLVQDEISRAEASILMNVSSQYLVPKDGTPLSGLIQDHVISGAKLSLRDTFLTRAEYMSLVYQALYVLSGEIRTLPPAIWKPRPLWTGKQVLSTIIINLTPKDKVPITLNSTSKIPLKAWNHKPSPLTSHLDEKDMSEFLVIIRHGELLSGILDKKQFGSTQYGLVHAVWDTHGGEHAISLLSCLAKLFTVYLQRVGFTLGVRDILVMREKDKKRSKIISKSRRLGQEAACNALGVPLDTPEDALRSQLEEAYATIPQFRMQLDRQYKGLLDKVTNNINKVCLPGGLIQPFPGNNLQFMVESGAKGSTVNTMQISCLLGQIELEGKRPAMTISGRTLPSFRPYEVSPRAGGFIDGRFMTGIQPQEFFFHCMAGREGLIDTAVKTSRSGYLQRCLVKHLEGLTIHYDMTVRDSDLSLIQVMYGEDGLDATKRQYLTPKQFSFLEDNIKSIVDKKDIRAMKESPSYAALSEIKEEIEQWRLKHGAEGRSRRQNPFTTFCEKMKESLAEYSAEAKVIEATGRTKSTVELLEQWYNLDEKSRKKFSKKLKSCPSPLISTFQPDAHFGSISETLSDLVTQYTKDKSNPSAVDRFKDMIYYKNLQSLANPGENVGVLAAQSIGEPSTQMTLNTFHFAGRGDMNVTLGIPRLREILMMASKNIKTPSMEIPFLEDLPKVEKKAERLSKSMTRVTVADVLEKVRVREWLELTPEPHMNYEMKFSFIPPHMYKHTSTVKPATIVNHFENKFLKELEVAYAKQVMKSTTHMNIEQSREKEDEPEDEEGDEAGGTAGAEAAADASSDEERDEEDAVQSSKKVNQEEDNDFEEPEEEEMMSEEEEDNDDIVEEKTPQSVHDKRTQETQHSQAESEKTDDNMSGTEDEELDERAQDVVNQHNIIHKYSYDKKNNLWCKVHLWLTMKCHRIHMSQVVRSCAARSVIHQVPGVKRAIVMETNGKHILKTDGINVNYISQYRHLLDLNKLYVNDIHYMARTYGIEAANRVIIREVKNVFAVYGIEVDPRHLSLVADYMTHNGSYVAMNRNGIRLNPSFIQKMTFEMPLEKIRQASIQGRDDSMRSPSARVMMGQECKQGTGLFQLRHAEVKKKKKQVGGK
uniref:DNA-directed RNA polymerase subunit n=2 Tax=Cacopsylla melanoneura TaxID=428564 RepID=A0A8D8YI58_9HEMI